MTSVWIYGISGRMGQALVRCLHADEEFCCRGGSTSTGDVDAQGNPLDLKTQLTSADAFIDFSTCTGNASLLRRLVAEQAQDKTVLIATTGLDNHDAWRQAAASLRMRLLFAPNTSVGIAVLLKSVLAAKKLLATSDFDIEIVETHNRHKRDAPSGTAKHLAAQLADHDTKTSSGRNAQRQMGEIGLHAVRGGDVSGEHTVSFFGMDEELHFTHRARDRRLFAKGALTLVSWLAAKDIGVYQLADV
ncbi:MAG: 4-hydroxy-tetrahydrodipicolinate reductase [Pseudomonadota bacterium]|nr:4-hydroxy-tetrahydrodipicolinate reductase [Pseudomonadota bacterium]